MLGKRLKVTSRLFPYILPLCNTNLCHLNRNNYEWKNIYKILYENELMAKISRIICYGNECFLVTSIVSKLYKFVEHMRGKS